MIGQKTHPEEGGVSEMTGARDTIDEDDDDDANEEEVVEEEEELELEASNFEAGTRSSVPSRKRLLLLIVGNTALFI